MPPPCPSITAIDFFFFSILTKIKKPLMAPPFWRRFTFVAEFYINGMSQFVKHYLFQTGRIPYLKYLRMALKRFLAIFSWNPLWLRRRSSSLLVMKATSTRTEGIYGALNTIKL